MYLSNWPWLVHAKHKQVAFSLQWVIMGFHVTWFLAESTKVAGPMSGEWHQPPWSVSTKVEDWWSRKAAVPDCTEEQSPKAGSARTLGMHPWSCTESLPPAQVVDSSGFVQLGQITQAWEQHKDGEYHGIYHEHRCQSSCCWLVRQPHCTTGGLQETQLLVTGPLELIQSLPKFFQLHTVGPSRNALSPC